MAREKTVEVAALNIAANPHPDRVYVEMLAQASNFLAHLRGSDYAKITSPKESSTPGVFVGRILVWTNIDVKGRWLDLKNEEALSADLKKTINIPDGAKPNYRVFNYVFVSKNHRFYFEIRNEFRETLSPGSGLALISNLLSQELLGLDAPETQVTIVPESGALKKILSLPHLRSLEIMVVLPNPDADEDAEARVFKRLNDARASKLTEIYTKQSGADHLVATEEIKETASVAVNNGRVVGVGRRDGRRVEISTAKLPKKKVLSLDWGG